MNFDLRIEVSEGSIEEDRKNNWISMNSSANLFVHFYKRRNVANKEKNYHSGKSKLQLHFQNEHSIAFSFISCGYIFELFNRRY